MRVLLLLFSLVLFSMPAFSVDDMEIWNPYLEKIEKDVKSSWYSLTANQRHDKECRTTMFFTVKNTGALGTIAILFSDCDKDMQDKALLAVKKVAPFAPFPIKFSNVDEININYNLDYRLLPENKNFKKEIKTSSPFVNDVLNNSSKNNSEVQGSQLPKVNKRVVVPRLLVYIIPVFLILDLFAFLALITLSKNPKVLVYKGLSIRRDILLFVIISIILLLILCLSVFFVIPEFANLHKMLRWF